MFSPISQAKIFRNAYLSFELPESWKCSPNQLEWVCRTQNANSLKDAIIAVSGKELGPEDTLNTYQTYLDHPITPSLEKLTSKIMYKSKYVKINDQTWIDSLHYQSELPEFYTRYLVTIKNQLSVLVTFSSHKNQYAKFNQDFFKAVSSLRIIANGNNLSMEGRRGLHGGSGDLFGSMNSTLLSSTADLNEDLKNQTNKKLLKKILFFVCLFILIGACVFYFYRSNKKK